jgi:hypothetical protein
MTIPAIAPSAAEDAAIKSQAYMSIRPALVISQNVGLGIVRKSH